MTTKRIVAGCYLFGVSAGLVVLGLLMIHGLMKYRDYWDWVDYLGLITGSLSVVVGSATIAFGIRAWLVDGGNAWNWW